MNQEIKPQKLTSTQKPTIMKNKFQSIKRFSMLALLITLFSFGAKAQYTGTYYIPATYGSPNFASINAMVTALNAGTIASSVIINIQPGYTEVMPATGLRLGSAGLNASMTGKTLTIQKGGAGTNPIMVGFTGTLAPAAAGVGDNVFALLGIDNVTIDGIDIQDATANVTATTQMEYGYAMYKLNAISPFDGCQNNTIKNCTITLNRTDVASTGIFCDNRQYNSATQLVVTLATDAASNNKFYTNTIRNVYSGMYLRGYTTTTLAAKETGNDIGGSSAATGNQILSWGGTLVGYGIYAYNQINFNISYNTINNYNGGLNGGIGAVAGSTLYGIYNYNASVNYVNQNLTENNNTIILTEAAGSTAGGYGIYNYYNEGQRSVQNNSVSWVTLAGTVCTGAYYCFYDYSPLAGATAGMAYTFAGNIINNVTINNSTGAFVGFYCYGHGGYSNDISNNQFTNFTRTGATSGVVYTMYSSYDINYTTAGSTGTMHDNTINNINNGNSTGAMYGYWAPGGGPGTTCNMYNNTITNISNTSVAGGTWQNYMPYYYSNATVNVYNNTIGNITMGSTINGNYIYGYYMPTINFYNNTINNLNATVNGANVIGIYSYYTGGTFNCYNNKVTNVNTTNIGIGSCYGIWDYSYAGGVANGNKNYYNNYIGNFSNINSTSTNAMVGMLFSSGGTASTNIYDNTIYLTGTNSGASSASWGTYGIMTNTATRLLDIRNNLIINNTNNVNASPTGFIGCIRGANTTPSAWYNSNSNRNILWAGTPSSSHVIYYDGTNNYQTLGSFQSFIAPREANSKSENTTFISTTVGNPNYLHVDNTIPTYAESFGGTTQLVASATITTDADGDIRYGNGGYAGSGTGLDIGADEFNGVSITIIDVALSGPFAPASATCNGTQTVSVSLTNAGTVLLDFATNPVTVNASVTGPNPMTFSPITVNSGTLAAGASQVLTFSVAYAFNVGGTYAFTYSFVSAYPGDAVPSNNTGVSTITITPTFTNPTVVATPSTLCPGANSTITANSIASTTASLYSFSQFSGSYTPNVVGSGATQIGGPSDDDSYYGGQPIGFTFNYLGSNYTTIGVSSNGWTWFGSGTPTNNYTPLSTATAQAGIIAPLAQDQQGTGTGEMSYQTTGVAPNRVCTIQWRNWTKWSSATYAATIIQNYQVLLYETSNIIECRYGPQTYTNASSFGYQVGIGGSVVTDFNNRVVISGTNTWATSTAGGANSATASMNNVPLVPSSGQVYQWTPPPSSFTYTWSPSTYLSSTTGSPVTATAVTSTVTYTVTASNGGGCVTQGTAILQVNPLVVTPTATGQASGSYCTPANPTYSGTMYMNNFIIAGTTLNNPNTFTPTTQYTNYPATGSTTATLTAGTTYSCTVGSQTYQQNFYAYIDLDNNGDFTGAGETLINGASILPGNNSANITVPASIATGQHRIRLRSEYYIYTLSSSCIGGTYAETEDYTVNVIGGTTPCGGTQFALAPGITGGGTPTVYSWTSTPAGFTSSSANVTVNPTSTTTYNLSVTDNCGSTSVGSVVVTVQTVPTISVTPTSASYCTGATPIGLTASGAGILSWSWSPSAGLSGTTGASVNASPSVTTTYTVSGSTGGTCNATATSIITFAGVGPTIGSVTASPSTVCYNGTTTLTAAATGAPLLSENWTSGTFGSWTFSPSQGNWLVAAAYTPVGGTAPNAYFNWSPSFTNYTYSLVSPVINGTGVTSASLSFLLQLNNFSTSTLEQFIVEYKKTTDLTWTTLQNYTNAAGSFNIAVNGQTLVGMAGFNFQIRFTAYGQNSFNINGWGLDNIIVNGNGGLSYTWSVGSGPGGLTSTTTNPTTGNALTANTTYNVAVSNGTCTSNSSVNVVAGATLVVSPTATYSPPASTVANYVFSQSNGTYTPLVGATTVVGPGGFNDDAGFGPFNLGFTFTYHGVPFTTIGIQDNCSVALGATATSSYGAILSTQTQAIAVMNADMLGNSANNQIRYLLTGGAGNHVFTIEWFNWGKYSSGLNEIDIQLKLYEATGVVQIIYNPETPSTAFVCEVGMTGSAVSDFNNRTSTSTWSGSTAGLSNTATMSFSGAIYPVSGLTYTWTPPTTLACAGTATFNLSAGVVGGGSPYTYAWTSNPAGFTSSSANPTVIPTATTTYTCQVTDNCGVIQSGSAVATVLPSPLISVTPAGPISYCSNAAPVALNTVLGGGSIPVTSYSWSPSAGLSSTTTAATNANPSSSTTYTSSATGNNGCVANASVIFNVSNPPTLVGITATPSANLCLNGTATLTANLGASGSYCLPTMFATNGCNYLNSVTTTGGVSNITTPLAPGYNGTGATYYPAGIVSQNVGSSFSLVCQAQGTCGIAYYHVWVDWNQNGTFDEPSEHIVTANGTNSGNNITTFVINVPLGAVPGSTRMRVLVDGNSVNPVTACDNLSGYYSENEDYVVTVLGGSPYTFSWSPSTFLGATSTSNPATATNMTSTTTYTLTVTNGAGCSSNGNVTVNVAAPITATPTATLPSTTPCAPTVSIAGATGDYIDNFTFANLTNNASGDAPSDYTFYNSLTANVIAGNTYNLSMQSGPSWAQGFAVWIDYNKDGIFDPAENIFTSSSAATTVFTGTATIPSTALNGTTRMRVVCLYAGVPANTVSCALTGFGEYEDYNVAITGGVNPGPPCGGAGVFTIAANAAGGGNPYSYSWTSNPAGFTSTAASFVVTPNVTTTYSVVITDNCGTISSPFSVVATVTTVPSATLSGGGNVCVGNTCQTLLVNFAGNAWPYHFTYTANGINPVTINGIYGSNYTFTVCPSASTTYAISNVGNNTACSQAGTGTAIVSVNATPVAGTASVTAPTVSANAVICVGGTVDLVLTGYNGNIDWQSTTTPTNVSSWVSTGTTTNTYTSAPLTQNTYYRAVVTTPGCYSAVSNTVAVLMSITPTVTLSNVTDNSMTVTFTPNQSNGGSYTISVNGGAPFAATSPYNLTGLTSGTAYTISVAETTPGTCGTSAGSANATTSCTAPSIVSATNILNTSATLNWTGGGPFVLYYRNITSGTLVTTSVNVATNTYNVTGLQTASTYAVYVTNVCGTANTMAGPIGYFTTTGTTCGIPTGVTATVLCSKQVSVSWTAVSGITNYNVTYKRMTLPTGLTTVVVSGATSVILNTIPGQNYEIYVRSQCSPSGISAPSVPALATTPNILAAPQNVVISSPTCHSFTINWPAVAGAGGYVVEYQRLPNGPIYNTSTTLTTMQLPAGASGTYGIRVAARENCTPSATIVIGNWYPDAPGTPSSLQGNTLLCRDGDQTDGMTVANATDMNVYPNPNAGQFTISFVNNNDQEVTYTVTNILGQVVYTEAVNESAGEVKHAINLNEELSAGMYNVTVKSGDMRQTKNIILVKE